LACRGVDDRLPTLTEIAEDRERPELAAVGEVFLAEKTVHVADARVDALTRNEDDVDQGFELIPVEAALRQRPGKARFRGRTPDLVGIQTEEALAHGGHFVERVEPLELSAENVDRRIHVAPDSCDEVAMVAKLASSWIYIQPPAMAAIYSVASASHCSVGGNDRARACATTGKLPRACAPGRGVLSARRVDRAGPDVALSWPTARPSSSPSVRRAAHFFRERFTAGWRDPPVAGERGDQELVSGLAVAAFRSRQHGGHRHSTPAAPPGPLLRLRRHPKLLLSSV